MKTLLSHRLVFSQLVITVLLLFLSKTNLYAQQHDELKDYTNFLAKQNTSAKDYVLDLFKKYDIVILCERHHGETTQYDLIYDIVSSPYFEKNVGTIFTEVGSYSNRKNTLNFTKTKFTNDNIKQLKQATVYRNVFFPPLWNNTNFYDFMGKINSLNNTLKKDQQINLLTSGTKNPSLEERKNLDGMKKYVMENYPKRDSLMASYITKSFDSICLNSDRKKTLIIMNYRHAFSKDLLPKESNVSTYIFKKYPGKVANVYLNYLAYLDKIDERDKNKAKMFQGMQQTPIQDGKWDAAFKIANKDNLGFDFQNSPFGKDHFDIWSATKTNDHYEDIFTGFVFYLPLEKHTISKGINNFMYGLNFEEFINGWNLFNKALNKNDEKKYSPELQQELTKEMSTLKVFKYPDLEKYKEIINQWPK